MESTEAREIRDDLHKLELKIVEGFTTLRADHESLRKDLISRQEVQDKMVGTIYGNGQEGLITKVANITQKQKAIWATLTSVSVMSVGYILKNLLIK